MTVTFKSWLKNDPTGEERAPLTYVQCMACQQLTASTLPDVIGEFVETHSFRHEED